MPELTEKQALIQVLQDKGALQRAGFSPQEIDAGVKPQSLAIDDPRRRALMSEVHNVQFGVKDDKAIGQWRRGPNFMPPDQAKMIAQGQPQGAPQAPPQAPPQGLVAPPPPQEGAPVPPSIMDQSAMLPGIKTAAEVKPIVESKPAKKGSYLSKFAFTGEKGGNDTAPYAIPDALKPDTQQQGYWQRSGGVLGQVKGLGGAMYDASAGIAGGVGTALGNKIKQGVNIGKNALDTGNLILTGDPLEKGFLNLNRPLFSGGSSLTTQANNNAAPIVESVKEKLKNYTGADGYLSPDDYKDAKKQWQSLGDSAGDFDTLFSEYRNPDNPYYFSDTGNDFSNWKPITVNGQKFYQEGNTKNYISEDKYNSMIAGGATPMTGADQISQASEGDASNNDSFDPYKAGSVFTQGTTSTADFVNSDGTINWDAFSFKDFAPNIKSAADAYASKLGPEAYAYLALGRQGLVSPETMNAMLKNAYDSKYNLTGREATVLGMQSALDAVPEQVAEKIRERDKVLAPLKSQEDLIWNEYKKLALTPEVAGPQYFAARKNILSQLNDINDVRKTQMQAYDKILNSVVNAATQKVNDETNKYKIALNAYTRDLTFDTTNYKTAYDKMTGLEEEMYNSLVRQEEALTAKQKAEIDLTQQDFDNALKAAQYGLLGNDGLATEDDAKDIAKISADLDKGYITYDTIKDKYPLASDYVKQHFANIQLRNEKTPIINEFIQDVKDEVSGKGWFNLKGISDGERKKLHDKWDNSIGDANKVEEIIKMIESGQTPTIENFTSDQTTSLNLSSSPMQRLASLSGAPAVARIKAGTSLKPKLIALSPKDASGNDIECVGFSRILAPSLPRIPWSDTSKVKNANYKRRIINTKRPQVGAVAVMPTEGFYGHVANVISVNNDGTITIVEANYKDDQITSRTGTPRQLKIEGYYYNPKDVINTGPPGIV